MREILFRGQTRRYGEKVRMGDGQKLPSRWVYGGVLQGVGDHSIIYGGENENNPAAGLDKWVVYTDTLGQYTGLTDKNGKKIFEGDILKDDWGQIYKVFYTTTNCSFMVKCTVSENEWQTGNYRIGESWCGTIKVIGNIHDNPEILEVQHGNQ